MEFMLSEKCRRLLVHDNYKFYKHHNTEEGLKWRCVERKCLANIYTDENATIMLKTDLNHNHERDTNVKRQVIFNSVKRKATAELAKRLQKLIRKEISSAPSGYAEKFNVKDIECIRKSISRARRSIFPHLPQSITNVHAALASTDIKTHQEDKLLQIIDEEKNFVCFSTTSNLKYL
ncbi:hypothetical protein AVEN_255867-1 [Araneus ventricosus]|uniref:FLYWCH-type domain-containing protein n=1 Tax=Araneus ventricosus TaxID=182803 RepID=A0A4Y2DDQ2_ARAVE|nr:hypothetical protein AVEN_255867-1 [Araneus ventricosus]